MFYNIVRLTPQVWKCGCHFGIGRESPSRIHDFWSCPSRNSWHSFQKTSSRLFPMRNAKCWSLISPAIFYKNNYSIMHKTKNTHKKKNSNWCEIPQQLKQSKIACIMLVDHLPWPPGLTNRFLKFFPVPSHPFFGKYSLVLYNKNISWSSKQVFSFPFQFFAAGFHIWL